MSSLRRTTHGLLARHLLMRDESVLNDHLTRLQPADGLEFGMVEEMVASHWRLRRFGYRRHHGPPNKLKIKKVQNL